MIRWIRQLALVGGAFFAALLCLHVRATAADAPLTRPIIPRIPLPAPADVVTRQDPFISPLDDEGNPVPAASAASTSVAMPTRTVAVRAVIVGLHSYALIDVDGTQKYVTLGDPVTDSRVKTITISGVDLADGRHLNVASEVK